MKSWWKPSLVALAAAVAANIALNLVAARLGHSAPWVMGLNLTLALLTLGVAILAVARLATSSRSEASRMRDALDASKARLSAIVDSAMDAIITIDEQQNIVLFNRAAEQVFRCPREGALGSPLERFLPARFRSAHRRHIEQFGRTGTTSRRMGDATTLWALRAGSAEEFPVEASISQAAEGGRRYFTVILRDITTRKRSEDELRQSQAELRALSAQVLEAREEEKTRIARELHDELGQLLTAMKMDLAWLRERLPQAPGELADRAGRMGETLDRTVTSVRRIAADLRPLMLDDLGLADAAAWLVEDFGQRAGIRCEFRVEGDLDGAGLDRSAAGTVYRALQESLTNIARHAAASEARVLLRAGADGVHLQVEDDGRGISEQDKARSGSFGLRGMRERVQHAGGSLEIGTAARGGTRVSVKVPAPAARSGARP
ncbi:MAG TPA: PAS domain-containing sensor histidine kinase [Burkholderiales bacterium]|nr:PAS domain-containing sensor histidine kinase [Burkholderiales bacterium]